MYDKFGLPFYPLVFQFLMVLTFALHIIFVNFTWGGAILSFYFGLKKEEKFKELSLSIGKSLTIFFSLAMLFGIAPLLFVQTIYDYFWYSSNVFSGIYTLSFIFVLMFAFSLIYINYFSSKGPKFLNLLSFLLLSFAGVIMHTLNVQLLQISDWIKFWYPSSLGKLNHFEIYRFLHFFFASIAISGFFLLLNAYYLKKKGKSEEIVNLRADLGIKIFFYFTIIQAISGIWWLLMIPWKFKFYLNHFTIASILIFIILLYFTIKALKNPLKYIYHLSINLFILILFMSANRESLRFMILKESGFSLSNYPLNLHYPSLILFLITFLLAIFVSFFFISLSFKSGMKDEKLESLFLNKLAKISIYGLILWILVVGGLGIYIYVKPL